jgi:pimeloyl-ACP methyl ester carboxylesterase
MGQTRRVVAGIPLRFTPSSDAVEIVEANEALCRIVAIHLRGHGGSDAP